MPRPETHLARWLAPRSTLVLLLALHAVASRAGGAPVKAERTPESEARPADAVDTHRRLDEIYRRLGIKRTEGRDVPQSEGEGCRCSRKTAERPDPESGPRLPELRTPAMPPFLGYLLIGVVIAAMLIPLYLSLRTSYQRSSPQAEPAPEEDGDRSAAAPAQGPWQVDLEACRRLLAAGRLAEAFAALHRAFLLALEGQHHLSLDPKTTNWEYVRRLSSRPELRQALAAVTVAAEASVLGQHPPTREHYLALEERVVAVSREGTP